MNHSFPEQHLHLIEVAVAGKLTPSEHQELEQALRESPLLRNRYLEAMKLHLELDLLSQQEDVSLDLLHENRPVKRIGRGMRWLPVAGMLVVTISAFMLGRIGNHSNLSESPGWQVSETPAASPPLPAELSAKQPALQPQTEKNDPIPEAIAEAADKQSVPLIMQAANARLLGEGFTPIPGQPLVYHQQYVLSQGYLAIKFPQGAEAILKSPCIFNVVDANKLKVLSGQCSVHVPEGAEGFQVVSPLAEVVDLGTRFVINVAETGETELAVIEGAATLASTGGTTSDPVLLKTGEAARVDPGSLPEMIPAEQQNARFLKSLPDRVIRYEATKTPEGYADELLSVHVQRGGEVLEYERNQLIRSRLVHFETGVDRATFCTRMDEPLPEGAARLALLDEDWSLATGIVNAQPSNPKLEDPRRKPVMIVEFAEPIVNGPGPELLLFDLHILVSNPSGDTVRLRSGEKISQRPIYETSQFDIDLNSPFALNLLPHKTYRSQFPTHNLQDLINNEFLHGRQVHVNARGLVLGVDLSDLGHKPGETLQKLEFLSVNSSNMADYVLIVGLPAAEPVTENP